MQSKDTARRSFRAAIEGAARGRAYLVLPFDPEKAWGPRARYHVRGTINGRDVRGALEQFSKGHFLPLGPAYRSGAGLNLGDPVTVMLEPEGPQSDALAPPHSTLNRRRRSALMGWQPSIARTTCDGLTLPGAALKCARSASRSLSS